MRADNVSNQDETALIDKLFSFIKSIGIEISEGEMIEGKEVLPGICIHYGTIIIDRCKLKYPGDLLHEAAHLAVARPEKRPLMDGLLESDDDESKGEELMSIPWSYAAALHLGLDPEIVFHEHGYKNAGKSIIENFSEGRFFGVSTLQWIGLTYEPGKTVNKGVEPFPHMVEWIRK